MPSNALNSQFKAQIADFEAKVQLASKTDDQLSQKFAEQRESMTLLSKTRHDLEGQIP